MRDVRLREVDVECVLFDRAERIIFYGGSYSGKTHMLQQLIVRHHEKFKRIIICGTKNELMNHPETKSKTEHFDNQKNPIFDPFEIKDDDGDGDDDGCDDDDDRQTLIILDDVMSEAYNSQVVNKMFARGRHMNISVILILQSFFPQGNSKSLIPMIKNNASVQIFFRLRNHAEMGMASKKIEFDKKSQDFFLDLIKQEVNNRRFGYVAVYMDESDPRLKFRTNLVYEDGCQYETAFSR